MNDWSIYYSAEVGTCMSSEGEMVKKNAYLYSLKKVIVSFLVTYPNILYAVVELQCLVHLSIYSSTQKRQVRKVCG